MLKDILTIKDLTKEQIENVLKRSHEMKLEAPEDLMKGLLMANCFFEPSTRTRLSFEAAMKRLGGEVIGFSDQQMISTAKGETLHDTMKIVGLYADVIVIRHPLEGAAQLAANVTDKPVINAGDGSNEHPTQTLLDLFTIQECQNTLENLNIAFVGDLLFGRTVHSLAMAFKHFKSRLYFVSPPQLAMPRKVSENLKQNSVPFSFHSSVEEIIDRVDIIYVTRVQKERFSDREQYEQLKNHFVITPELINRGKNSLKVMHPLPRNDEIDRRVDPMEQAYYFEQAKNGMYVRQSLLATVVGR